MNKVYRIIWNSALGLWVVASELSRGKTKSTVSSGTTLSRTVTPIFRSKKSLLSAIVSVVLMGTSAVATGATDITIDPTVTVGEFNNKASSISVNGGTVNLSGDTIFSGSTGVDKRLYSIVEGYNAGYVNGAVDPNGTFTLVYGSQSGSVVVPDPITGGATTVNIYNNSNITQVTPGGAFGFYVYKPTPAGASPFIEAEIANVTNGGTLNINVNGMVGDTSVKSTAFIKVTDGTANWNSSNVVEFADIYADVTFGSLVPANQLIATQTYNGTFTVTTSDGVQTRTVNNLADFQAYNSWLATQLAAGKLGSGTAAQSAYNAAIAAAVTTTSNNYQLIRDPLLIPASDPLYQANGTQTAMHADGVNALAQVGTTGSITLSSGKAALLASNGATVINNGTVTTFGYNEPGGLVANLGGHAINNGVRNLGELSGLRSSGGFDSVAGAGSTYVNNGVVNLAGWNRNNTTGSKNIGLYVRNGASAENHGTYNVGTITTTGTSTLYGVVLDLGSAYFANETDGVMYLGREGSTDTTSASIARGGANVVQTIGGDLIRVSATSAVVDNKGSLIVGDLVQNGRAINITNVLPVHVTNHGTITVNGHYSASPGVNYGISTVNSATGTVVDNAGTINLLGINNIGIQTSLGAKALSSGTINITGGTDPASGLRNYGLWSHNPNSKITLTGKVNLAGTGAIGVHARDGGSIAIDGSGEVKFVSGTDQIGFFVYGPAASLTNTGSGTMNVSTERSTLFRMEDGADFTGGTGAGSALTASGKDSVAVMVTGLTGTDVSAYNSGGMTLNLSGENATGVLVEGGAQGKIAAIANINLIGVGAIAGIADGQKHDLAGANVGAPIAGVLNNATLDAGVAGFGTGTLLVAGANLNSSLDDVTGYIARNRSTLSNSGNITFSGKNTTGIQVLDGSVGGNSGSITLQDGGIGLIASSSNLATTINNSGNLVLKGGTNANRTKGIQASGSAVTVNMTGGSIDMQGQGAVGVEAMAGGKVILSGNSLPVFAAEATGVTDQIAFRVIGTGSSILTSLLPGNILDASGKQSTLFRIEDGAAQSGVLQMQTSGKDSNGIWATGAGTTVIASSGSDFQILGAGAKGMYITGAAKGTLKSGTTVSLVGDGAVVGVVDGNEYDLAGNILTSNTGSTLTNESNITSTLNNAIGFITQNQGLLVNKGNIDFTLGSGNTGVKVINGKFENTSSDIKVNGVAVSVEGAGSVVTSTGGNIVATNGEAAIKLGQDASLNLAGSGLGTVEGQGTAHGVLLDTGAKGLIIAGAKINVNAAGATGNGVENKAEISGLQLTGTTQINVADGKGIRTAATLAQTNQGSINVSGSGTGLAFETATGGVVANTSQLDMSDSTALVINLNGVGGTGILVNTADDATVKSGASVNVAQANGGSALVVNNSAASVIQSGNLNS
ncbi:ESPR domain-containing protein, partial [Budvicia diplopodorum]|uniref:ESPR domain-containing protein n=1 Tax=Budvicia diplopodorum TaxID=1119056 RepID=UPI001BAC16B5